MKLSKASRLANGLQNKCEVVSLQNAVKQSDSREARSLPVSFTRTGIIRASGATLQLQEGSRRNIWRQYLITRSTSVRFQRLLFRLAATTKRAPGWSGKWDSAKKVASKTQGQKVILFSGPCNAMNVNI